MSNDTVDKRFIVTRGRFVGRVAKCRLIQFILQQEHEAGRKRDRARVMLLAQKKLDEYPPSYRNSTKLAAKDYHRALSLFNKNPAEIPKAQGPGEVPVPVPPQQLLPGATAFTKEDLLAAARFLRHCGTSLRRAKDLLDFLFVLTRESQNAEHESP